MGEDEDAHTPGIETADERRYRFWGCGSRPFESAFAAEHPGRRAASAARAESKVARHPWCHGHPASDIMPEAAGP